MGTSTIHLADMAERLKSTATRSVDTMRLFDGATDDLWLWANTEGVRQFPELRDVLPALPPSDMQLRWTGKEGDETLQEGHLIATAVKANYERFREPLHEDTRVLDFGCGWGRVLRFFLKDVAPSSLHGIDASEELVEFSRTSQPACQFSINDPFPPTTLAAGSFDLAYAYSLFTHFSEEMHLEWLSEMRRLLVPGGIFVATVRPRGFISYTDRLGDQTADTHQAQLSLRSIFGDAARALEKYDNGEFVYAPYPSSRYGDWWGEACISREYVHRRWGGLFQVLDFIEDPRFKQHMVVLRRPRA